MDDKDLSDKLPLLLSAVLLPGLGQFVQRRWIAGTFYLLTAGGAFLTLAFRVVRALMHNLKTALEWADATNVNTPFMAIMEAGILMPFFIGLFFYTLNLCDVQYVQMARKRQLAEQAFARQWNSTRSLLLAFCLIMANALNASPLHDAVRLGDANRVGSMLEGAGQALVNDRIGGGITPLHIAAATDRLPVAAILISMGADIDARTTSGFTPLHWAAGRNAVHTARLLLQMGADINALSENGVSPLHWAAGRNATNVVRLLLQKGADFQAVSELGLTPLHWAVRSGADDSSAMLAFRAVENDPIPPPLDLEMDLVSPPRTNTPPVPPPPVTSIPPGPTAIPGQTLVVPLGFGEELRLVWIEPLGIWFGKYEVTNGQFRRFRPAHNSLFRESFDLNGDTQPVVYASWHDATAFCDWLNRHLAERLPEKCQFRLPTSSEWQTVTRCGDNRTYPWGNSLPPTYGNYSDRTAQRAFPEWTGVRHYDDGFIVSAPVEQSGSNTWAIYGLAGNVWEWCLDWYDTRQLYRVRQGASWDFDSDILLRIDTRGFDRPDARYDTLGFRVVVSGPPMK